MTIHPLARLFAMAVLLLAHATCRASDHLDTAAVIADPAADIGDLYAWMSPDGRRLNLAMTIVGKKFSDHVRYEFHVDSGRRDRKFSATTTIACEFLAATAPECTAGDADRLRGDASATAGIAGQRGRFRVFAGLRDDPFFNNVRGTRAALNIAAGRSPLARRAMSPAVRASTVPPWRASSMSGAKRTDTRARICWPEGRRLRWSYPWISTS